MVDSLLNPEIKIELQGEERKVEFKLKNFAALKRIYGISEGELLNGLIQGDTGMLPYAIWCSTLKFAPFDPAEPLKIESQANLEELFELNLLELKELSDKVVQAVEAYLPKKPQDHKPATKGGWERGAEGGSKKKTASKNKKNM